MPELIQLNHATSTVSNTKTKNDLCLIAFAITTDKTSKRMKTEKAEGKQPKTQEQD